MRVMIVPTVSPPMMVMAMEPYMGSPTRGIMPTMVVSEAMSTGAHTGYRGFDHRVIGHLVFLIDEPVDFIDENDGILDHHTHETHHADDGHERERLLQEVERGYNTAHDKRQTEKYEPHLLPVVEEQQQYSQK